GIYQPARLPVRRPLATGWYRQKSTVGDRFRPLAVDFDCQRSIEGEKRKKKKKKRIKRREEENIAPVLARGSSARRRLRIARAHCRPHPRGDKDRGDGCRPDVAGRKNLPAAISFLANKAAIYSSHRVR
ncbi:hypothetical protein BHE74_00006437, partial [Ensete ventricosum]